MDTVKAKPTPGPWYVSTFEKRSTTPTDTWTPERLASRATPEQIRIARTIADDGQGLIQIDDDALLSECDDGSYWVQAWVRVSSDD